MLERGVSSFRKGDFAKFYASSWFYLYLFVALCLGRAEMLYLILRHMFVYLFNDLFTCSCSCGLFSGWGRAGASFSRGTQASLAAEHRL